MAKSPLLGIEQVAENQASKHIVINDAINALENAANKKVDLDLTAADLTMTETVFTSAFVFLAFGHAVARVITLPITVNGVSTQRVMLFRNDGTGDVTVRGGVAPAGTVVVPAGGKAIVSAIGNDIQSLFAVGGASSTGDEVNMGLFVPGKPDGGVEVLRHPLARGVLFPANFTGSRGSLRVNPTLAISFGVFKNAVSVGTIDVSTGGVYTFATSGGAPVTFNTGDILTITAPATQDVTAEDFGITLKGTKV